MLSVNYPLPHQTYNLMSNHPHQPLILPNIFLSLFLWLLFHHFNQLFNSSTPIPLTTRIVLLLNLKKPRLYSVVALTLQAHSSMQARVLLMVSDMGLGLRLVLAL